MDDSKRKIGLKYNEHGAAYGYPIIAFLSIFVFFAAFLLFKLKKEVYPGEDLLSRIVQNDYLSYFLALAIMAVVFVALRFAFAYVSEKKMGMVFETELKRPARYAVFLFFALLFLALLTLYIFVTEQANEIPGEDTLSLPWRHLPFGLVFAVLLALVCWNVRHITTGEKLSVSLVYLGYGIAVVLTYYSFLFLHVPDLYHGAAYTETITNTMHGTPFNIYTSGIYGHHALFFAPLVWLFGGSAFAMLRLIALSGAIATALCAYIIHNTVSRNNIRILSVFTCITTLIAFRLRNYWQLQPHRILFPLIIVAFVVYLSKRDRYEKKWVLIGFGLCAAAIVWNTESGMFSLLGYVLALIVRFWQRLRWNSREMLLHYAEWGVCSLIAIMLPILLVNFYNLCCGGEFIFLDFFFPLFTTSYMTGELAISVAEGYQVWYMAIILFLVLIFYALYHTGFIRRDAENGFDQHAPAYITLGVVALLSISYYINRAAYNNLDICIQFAGITMGIFAGLFADDWRDVFFKTKSFVRAMAGGFAFVQLVILVVLSAQVLTIGNHFTLRNDRQFWNKELFLEEAAAFEEILPEGEYIVVGCGSNLYMMQIGRTSLEHYRDFSDITVGEAQANVRERIVEDAYKHGKIALYLSEHHAKAISQTLAESGDFELVSSGIVGEFELVCYEMID